MYCILTHARNAGFFSTKCRFFHNSIFFPVQIILTSFKQCALQFKYPLHFLQVNRQDTHTVTALHCTTHYTPLLETIDQVGSVDNAFDLSYR